MNQNEYFMMVFNSLVNQALVNRESNWKALPIDQQQELNKMLNAIHDFIQGKNNIRPEYQAQVFDAVVLKVAAEIGMVVGGYTT